MYNEWWLDCQVHILSHWQNHYELIIFIDRFELMLKLLIVVDLCRAYYRYWTGYYGLPVAGWNAGGDGRNYLNIKGWEQQSSLFNKKKMIVWIVYVNAREKQILVDKPLNTELDKPRKNRFVFSKNQVDYYPACVCEPKNRTRTKCERNKATNCKSAVCCWWFSMWPVWCGLL